LYLYFFSETGEDKNQRSNSATDSPKIKEIQTLRHDMSHCRFNLRTAFLCALCSVFYELQDESHPRENKCVLNQFKV